MKKLIIALAAGVASMGAAQAQTTTDTSNYTAPRPYIGVGVSTAKNQASDDWRAGGKVFGGYELNQNWAVEGGYTHFGSRDYDTNNAAGVAGRASVKGNSSYVAAKYTMPINDRFSAYGKLGASYNERKNRIAGEGEYNERDTGLYGGLGVQYALNEKAAIVGEYERYGKDKATGSEANVVSVGLKYGF
jgi:OOP family OmpA-OmpF porin